MTRLGAGADLFVMEATLQGVSGEHYLMTAGEAGTWAARAGARRLLLTHFWPGSDRVKSVTEAAQTFGGEIIAAQDGLSIEL